MLSQCISIAVSKVAHFVPMFLFCIVIISITGNICLNSRKSKSGKVDIWEVKIYKVDVWEADKCKIDTWDADICKVDMWEVEICKVDIWEF